MCVLSWSLVVSSEPRLTEVLGTAITILSNSQIIIKHYYILLLKAFKFMFRTQWLREDFWCLLFLFSIVSQELSFQPSKNRNNLTFGLHICQRSKLHSVAGKMIYFIRQTYSWKKATSWWTQIHKQMKIKVFVISTLYSIVFASLQKLCLKHLWTIRIPLTQLTQSIQWLCHLCTLWEKALLPVNTIFCAKSSFF